MTKLNYLLGGIFISSTLFFSSCGETATTQEQKNTPEYNIIASVKNPAGLFSIDLMDLLKKSNIKESKEMPLQFKMIVNTQIDQHFNSENQGFELEGNIPFVISTSDDGAFNYVMSTFTVLDAEKIGPSLCLYFNGKVQKKEGISSLDVTFPGAPIKGNFTWDEQKMVLVLTEQANSKAIAMQLLSNKTIDAPENNKILDFLEKDNDFSSLMYMDTYTKMANQLSNTKMDEELIAAYDGMTMIGTGNFSNGNFKFDSELESENFIHSKFNNLNDTPLNAEYSKYLTDNGQLIAFGGASLNLDAIVNVINHTKYEYDQYGEELSRMGLRIEDLNSIFDGQYSASLMDIESIPTEGYEGNLAFNQERPKFLLACGIKDVEKLTNLLTNTEKVKPVNNYFLIDDLYIGMNEKKLFVSLNDELIQKLVNGETLVHYKTNFKTPLNGELIANTNQLPEGFKKALLKKDGGQEVLKLYNLIEQIQFNGDIKHTTFNIEFTDQSKNSLEVFSNAVLENLLPIIMQMNGNIFP